MILLLLAAFATAAGLIVMLPDAGLWPFAFLALVPLLVVLPRLSWPRALLCGWLAGLAAHAGIFHWIAHTAVSMSDFPWALAAGIVLIYSAWSGLAYGVFAVAARALLPMPGAALSVPAALVAVELSWPHLFPWHVGNAFFRAPLLMQGMDVTGVYGGTFVAVAVATAIALAVRDRSWRVAIPGAVVLAAWLGYGTWRLDEVRSEPHARTVRLALVQPDVTAEDKKRRDPESRKEIFARERELTLGANLDGVDAIIWPEGAFSFYWEPFAEGRPGWRTIVETSKRLAELVREIGKPLVFGSLTDADGVQHNTAVMLGPDGLEVMRYYKRRLLAFGEYMPLSGTFPWLKAQVKEVADLEPGTRPIAFPLGGAKALASICYEAILPGFTRDAVNETGADMLLNLTNDAWFGTSGAPTQHLMVQAPRAVELRMPLVRVTETGITAVLLASGDFVLETGVHERRVDVVDVPVPGGTSVYRDLGDVFAWGCTIGVAGLLALAALRHRRGKKSLSTTIG